MKNDSWLFPEDLPFDGLFDLDGDGEISGFESFIRDDHWLNELEDEDKPKIPDYLVEEGEQYCIYPGNYDSVEAFKADLDEAKYGWRFFVDSDDVVLVDPEDYETEDDYKEALEKAKYGWREEVDFENVALVDPDAYETKEDYEEALEEEKYAWRDLVDYDDALLLDPEDYETEEDYEEALAQEKAGGIDVFESIDSQSTWDDDDEDYGDSDELDPADFPNGRSYQAAVLLADGLCFNETEKELRRFILKKADTVTAAKYITQFGVFLFSQAIKDNFDLPCNLPDEDEEQRMSLSDIVNKISRYDCSLAVRVWAWCLNVFGPYIKYWEYGSYHLTQSVVTWLKHAAKPDDLRHAVVQYMSQDTAFCKNVILLDKDCSSSLSELIAVALHEKLYETAELLFATTIQKENQKWDDVIDLITFTIEECEDHIDSLIYFRDYLFPYVRKLTDGMVLDEIPVFEEMITKYLSEAEESTDGFTRAIRGAIEDAVSPAKIVWKDNLACTLEVETATDEVEVQPSVDAVQRPKEQKAAQKKRAYQDEADALIEAYEDKRIYTFCNVLFRIGAKPYCYLTDDTSIKIGDRVVVEVGKENREETGTVVSVGQYLRYAAPYPIEKTKKILRKSEA